MSRSVRGFTLLLLSFVSAPVAVADDFSIGEITGLQWWADAKPAHLFQNPDGTGEVGNGDPVGFITDLSGHGNNGVMGSAIVPGGNAFRPTFLRDATHGRGGILFDGVDDYSDLQGNLINGAAELTLAFAIDGAGTFLGGKRAWGASDGSDIGGLSFGGNGGPSVAFRLRDGRLATTTDSTGIGFRTSTDKDTSLIIVSRLKADGTAEIWVNGVRRDRQTLPPSANNAIRSLQMKFLGTQNGASTAGDISPLSGDGGKFHFLEGMVATSAISDAQVGQLYNYLSNKWPGAQALDVSPNLYWNAASNSDRTVPVPDSGHIQGLAIGAPDRFVFHTSLIEKYDANWKQIGSNQSVFVGIPTNHGPLNHVGDGDFYAGKLFVPVEAGLGGTAQFIGVYDATAPGLPLITTHDITDQHHEVSSMVVVPEHGSRGVIYATSFEANAGGDKLWMYNLQNGDTNSPDFGDFVGSLTIPSSIVGIQGIAWHAPYFYFSAAGGVGGNRIERVKYLDGTLDDHSEVVLRGATTVQGLAFDDDLAMQVFQSGSATEYITTFRNLDFAPVSVPEPSSMALFAAGGLLSLFAWRRRHKNTHP